MKNPNDQYQYLLIGSGRTARHLQNYFRLQQISFSTWSRSQSFSELATLLEKASHVLLLISDSAIEPFFKEHLAGSGKKVVHFSGALELPGIVSAHPLMTFSGQAYDLKTYQQIPFVLTSKEPFSEVLPGLTNPHFQIPEEKKAFYHAMCVMSGNFTNLLWKKMSEELVGLGLPENVFHPYLKQITQNILADSQGSLTGPIARKDLTTVKKNVLSLNDDNYQEIYRAFLKVYFPESIKELST